MGKVKDLSLHNGKISLHVHSYLLLINKQAQPVVVDKFITAEENCHKSFSNSSKTMQLFQQKLLVLLFLTDTLWCLWEGWTAYVLG